MELEHMQNAGVFIFMNEAGFNLAKQQQGDNWQRHRHTNQSLAHAAQNASPFPWWHQRMRRDEGARVRAKASVFVVVWDSVAFHHSIAATEWYIAHLRMSSFFMPPYSPFLFGWRWKVYDQGPYDYIITRWLCWKTFLQSKVKYGSDLPRDTTLDVLLERMSCVMFRTCGRIQMRG